MRLCLTADLFLKVASIFFFVGGFLLYERAEKKIGDLLMKWWVRIDDAQKNNSSKSTAFIRGISRLASHGFDLLLGKELLSARSIVVSLGASLSFTLASVFLLGAYADFINHLHGIQKGTIIRDMVTCLSFVCLGITPAFIRKRWWLVGWGMLVLVSGRVLLYVAYILFRVRGLAPTIHYFEFIGVVILLSYFFDVLYVVATRMMLRKTQKSQSVGITLMVLGNLVLCVFFVFGPVLAGVKFLVWNGKGSIFIAALLIASPAVNAVDIVASAVCFALAVFTLCYRFGFWPLVGRPLYGLARLSITQRRALLWAIGVCLWENQLVLKWFCDKR